MQAVGASGASEMQSGDMHENVQKSLAPRRRDGEPLTQKGSGREIETDTEESLGQGQGSPGAVSGRTKRKLEGSDWFMTTKGRPERRGMVAAIRLKNGKSFAPTMTIDACVVASKNLI